LHLAEQKRISPSLVFLTNFIRLQKQVRFPLLNQVGLMSSCLQVAVVGEDKIIVRVQLLAVVAVALAEFYNLQFI